MNNKLKVLVRKQVLDFLKDQKISIITHEGHEYTEFNKLSEYFGINKSNASRNRQDHPDLAVQLPKNGREIWFIRIDFIPWWVAKSNLNHRDKSPDAKKRKVDFLNKIGIPIPEAPQYLYFAKSNETGYIKIGVTTNYRSGGRMNMLKQTDGECSFLAVFQIPKAYEWEGKIHRLFGNLHITGEWFKEEKRLIDFIENLKTDLTH